MSTKQPTTAQGVKSARATHAEAVNAEADHQTALAAAESDLADKQGRPNEVTGLDIATARAEVERHVLMAPAFAQTVADAQTELGYAISDTLVGSLSGRFDTAALSTDLLTLESAITSAIAGIASAIAEWNQRVDTAVLECRSVGLVAGSCDPLAVAFATGDGSLSIGGETIRRWGVPETIHARLANAASRAGYSNVVGTVAA